MNIFDMSRPVSGKAKTTINRPVGAVFCFVGDKFFVNYPKWSPEVAEFTPLTGENVYVGAKAQQIRVDQGQKVESVLEVAEFDPQKKVTLVGVEAPFRNTYQFVGAENQDTTELEFCFELLELELFMRPFEKLIRTAIEEGAENTVANIKKLLSEEAIHTNPQDDTPGVCL